MRVFNATLTLRVINVALERRFRICSQTKVADCFFIYFEYLINLLDLERSQKVDLVICRFHGPI